MTQLRTPLTKLLLLFTVLLTLTGSLSAVTINVPGDYATIQGAIDGASIGDTVQVAAGTYTENINFNGKNISVIGAGPDLSIIDGGGSGSVVTCDSGETSTTVLDGFTITNGSTNYGGGMYNNSSSPTVTNCTFSGNSAENGSDNYGGGMCNISSSSPTVTNCTFSSNTATWGGGMYNAYYSSPTVTNCILWGDSPDEIFNGGPSTSTPTVSFSDLQGGWPANTVDGGGNIYVDPLFVDADGPDNTIGTEDDNLYLLDSSPCIDAGDNEAVPAGISFDLDGNPRFVDSSLSPDTGNGTAPLVDMGPYENMGLCLGDDTSGDSDNDGICDNLDVCSGFDDNLDADGDGVPDGCDLCVGDNTSGDSDGDGFCDDIDACSGFDDNGPDTDSDGVPFGCDRCEGFDDNGPDSDGDGEPDACDTCSLPGDHNCDGIVNLLDLALLAHHWLETI
jgi:hypothetical protein